MQPTSDSFWEPGNYKRTTKRIEDGYKLCAELQNLVQERADIEKAYAKNLKSWSKKWQDLIEKGPEYGTMEAAWKGTLTEAERLADVHIRIKENLHNDVMSQIKTWQKDNYHKSMMHIKECKEMEDAYKKAQKPWAKYLAKVEKCKAEYHSACKSVRTAANQERNANSDSSLSQDQLKKMQDRVQKIKEEVQKCRDKYEQSLVEINKYNPIYVEDMKAVFVRCQDIEDTRLKFFKKALFSVHKCLNIADEPSIPQIYEELYHTVDNADAEKDLKWWSDNHGVTMPMAWPEFVEYTEEFREIAKGIKSKEALPTAPITLINQRPVDEDYSPPSNTRASTIPTSLNYNSNRSSVISKQSSTSTPTTEVAPTQKLGSQTSIRNGGTNGTAAAMSSTTTTAMKTSSSTGSNLSNNNNHLTNNKKTLPPEQNPFDEDDLDDEDDEVDILVDNGEPGVPVKALYDYEGAEADELTFKQGDVFDKLEDEDEQGWCKGRKDGRVGLYPANYVEVIP